MNPAKITSASCQSSSSIPVPTSSRVNSAETRRVQAVVEQVGDRVDVGDLPGDDPARGVAARGRRPAAAGSARTAGGAAPARPLPPSRPMPLMYARVVTAWTATATAKRDDDQRQRRDVVGPGQPRDLRRRPGRPATARPGWPGWRDDEDQDDQDLRPGAGRSRSRSSRRDRRRRNDDRPGETSSASSAAMPRQASAGDWLIGGAPVGQVGARRSSGPGTAARWPAARGACRRR